MARLMLTHESYRVELRKIRFDAGILRNVIRIGLPAGLQSVMYSFSNIFIQASINGFGTDAIAAWAAIGKIDGFIWMVMNAFGISVTTFVGQNFGARRYDRVKRCTRVGLLMALGTTIVLSALLGLFGIAASLNGYLFKHLPWLFRIILIGGGLGMMIPGTMSDLAGFVLVGGVVLLQYLGAKKETA